MVVVNARVKIIKLLTAILNVVQVHVYILKHFNKNNVLHDIVDGGWSNWSVGNCSKLCGGGNKTKIRTCSNPAPSCGGNNCIGKTVETVECNTISCIGMCIHTYLHYIVSYV